MTRARKLSITAILSLAILAACGGGGGQIGDAAAQFGQSFAAAFRATDRAEPAEPGPVTFLQVADTNEEMRLTQEPVEF
jgi:ABC-type glycerol-3-phosphate transport system substrate-binding protein